MSKKPLVSVLMPCYNHEKYVAEAIESVLNQTYENLELIVADNGSLDNSYEVIKKYEDRIRIIRLEKNNQMRCGQMLLEEASGEYLALMTSDDWWFPEKLAVQMEKMLNDKSIKACITYGEKCDENMETMNEEVFQMLGDCDCFTIFRLLFENGNCLAMPTAVFEIEKYRELMREHSRGYKQLADYDWWLTLSAENCLCIIPQILMKFRWHISNGTVNESAPTLDNMIRDKNERTEIAYERIDRLTDGFFVKAFSDVLQNKNPQSHAEVLCEKFLYLYSAEDSLFMSEVTRRFFHSHFAEMCDELTDKYNFPTAKYYKYIAENSLTTMYVYNQFEIAKLEEKEKESEEIIRMMYGAIKDCEGKLSLVSPEIREKIENVGKIVKRLADICGEIGNDTKYETYLQIVNEIKSIAKCINNLGKYMLFADVDVESEEWKTFIELVDIAGNQRVDLTECISEFLRMIEKRIEQA